MSTPLTSARLDALRALAVPRGRVPFGADADTLRDALAEAIAEIDRLHAKRAEWGAHYEWSETLVAAADAMRRAAACEAVFDEVSGQSVYDVPADLREPVRAYDAVREAYPRRE